MNLIGSVTLGILVTIFGRAYANEAKDKKTRMPITHVKMVKLNSLSKEEDRLNWSHWCFRK
jgi:hypothetical protein